MQVDPIKPTMKAPGTKRLKLKYDEPLSGFGFNFNLRRYIPRARAAHARRGGRGQGLTLVHFSAQPEPFDRNHLLNAPVAPPDTS